MKSSHSKQTARILAHLLENSNDECPAVDLHYVGSDYKRNGFVASLSRRISDCRQQGWHITCRREQNKQQVQTYYTLHT